MSAWWYVAGFAVMGTGGFIAVVGFTKGQPIRRQPVPQVQALIEESTVFAVELAAIDTPAPPNYRSGEYPLVDLPVAAGAPADWPTDEYLPLHTAPVLEGEAEPVEVDRAPEQSPVASGPWWAQPVTALHDEPTPLFNTGKPYPTCDLDLSATNSWNRAALRKLLDMDTEEAA